MKLEERDSAAKSARLPIIRDRKGEYRKEIWRAKLRFHQGKVETDFYELDEPPTLDKKFPPRHRRGLTALVVRERAGDTPARLHPQQPLDLATASPILRRPSPRASP